jgi:phosphoglycerate dehydrogenase-like enzyme
VTISDHTVAIIGTGNIGITLAANFATGGQDFLLARSYVGLAAFITLTWDFVVWRGRLVSTSG